MLEKNSATLAHSFSVAMTPSGDSSLGESEPSWFEDPGRSTVFTSSQQRSYDAITLKEKNSLYDAGESSFVACREDKLKVVTFFRESDSEKPELRIIIDARKYTNLEMFIDELSRILDLKHHERKIYNQSGRILRRLEDFEDGASYFFSFSNNDKRFMQALSVINDEPQTPREKAKNNWKKILNRKKRMINVITNESSSHAWRLFIDEAKLQSFSQLLHELNFIIQPRKGRVFRLCTTKGRRVRSLGELFAGNDTFVAIVSSIGMVENDELDGSYLGTDDVSPRKQRMHTPTKYDTITGKESGLERRLINVKGKCHVFHPPSTVTKAQPEFHSATKPPEPKLQIDWIYGFNGQKSRDNIFILQSEELVYHVATVAVIYDVYRHKQRYYTEHTMEITCMALHPNNWYIATGQSAPENYNIEVIDHIRIWNAEMLNTLAVLTLEEQTLSVTRLTFSLEDYGRRIASIDTDGNNYRLLVWQWNSKEIVARSKSYEEEESSVKFHPSSNKSLLSVGLNHVFHWNWRGSILEKSKGHVFDLEIPRAVNCIVYTSNGDFITGDSNGNLHFWQQGSRRIKKNIKNAHMGGIQTMVILAHDVLVTYGTDDHLLSLWETRNMEKNPTTAVKITGDYGTVTSIAVSPNHHDYNIGDIEFFLGTNKNKILHGTFKTEFKPLIQGHENETTCIAANPCYNHILTVGLDCRVLYRSIEDCSIVWEKKVEYPATSAAFYPHGNVMAVGMQSGRWCVLNTEDGSHIASFQGGRDPLTTMTYSSDGGTIAIGTATGEVYLFSVYDEGESYRFIASGRGNAAAISSIDWSKDGSYLRLMTVEWDQNILSTDQLSEIGDLTFTADLTWQTQNTTLSYATSGIWKPASDLRFLSADCSASRDLLCVGSEFGHTRLYTYPCWSKMANYREYSLHVGRVNKVCFLPSGVHLISSGQHDNAVVQWRIVFGKINNASWKTGFIKEHTIENNTDGWLTGRQLSSMGHRKMRQDDSPTSSTIENDPFARPSSVVVKRTGVENVPNDYYHRKQMLTPQEIQENLQQSGAGVSEQDIVLQKSHSFLQNYNVVTPITREQKRQRKQGKITQNFKKST